MNAKDFRPVRREGTRVSTPEYRSWQMMKNRCLNPKSKDYAYYGARGITICQEWLSFDGFFASMGPKPSPDMTLDRRDTNGPYSPDNCFWATRKEQARNRRFIKRYRGMTTWEWAEALGIKPKTFHHRLWRFNKGLIGEAQLFKSLKP